MCFSSLLVQIIKTENHVVKNLPMVPTKLSYATVYSTHLTWLHMVNMAAQAVTSPLSSEQTVHILYTLFIALWYLYHVYEIYHMICASYTLLVMTENMGTVNGSSSFQTNIIACMHRCKWYLYCLIDVLCSVAFSKWRLILEQVLHFNEHFNKHF